MQPGARPLKHGLAGTSPATTPLCGSIGPERALGHDLASAFSISGFMICWMFSGVTGPTSL
jgi:hypothetical protein